jgi:outer membrane protein OmpA-like peptidoglycan-associated protein
MMTNRGKLVLSLIILAVVGLGVWRWWDKLAPQATNPINGVTAAQIQDELKKQAAAPVKPAVDISGKLLAGDKAVSLIDGSSIPAVSGVSDYEAPMLNGKMIVKFPINVWPGWAPIIVANNGLKPNDGSIFYKKYGFYVELAIVDDPVKARDLFASGHSHVLWGTLDMMALFAPELTKDSRTIPVICQQIDWSNGGDGIVARNGIRNINDLRMKDGKRRKVVLAQNSPSHFMVMSLLIDAGIDPSQVDFKWAADAPAAAKIFVSDKSMDAFVGWAPDIYTVSDNVADTRLILSTQSANHLIADVWAVRNDFYRDHPDIVANLVRGIFDGMDMVRKDVPGAAKQLSAAFSIPVEDCTNMIGKDGGILTGDAHLTNYRENSNFFLDPMNPSNFEIVWNRASTIYKSLGSITAPVSPAKVKAAAVLVKMETEYKDVVDLSQPTFRPGAIYKNAEANTNELLSKAVIISFEANQSNLNVQYDSTIPAVLEEIGQLAGKFGNAYIVVEGNTDASRKGVIPADLVRQLSYERADSVRKAIVSKYKFDPNKFKVIGNGWDNPVPGMTDASNPDNNKKNRRVEIKVFPLEQE